jgi:uncharacterized protein
MQTELPPPFAAARRPAILRAFVPPAARAPVVMRIPVDQIEESAKHLSYVEDVAVLDDVHTQAPHDYDFAQGVEVDLEYYRAGLDVFFDGGVRAPVRGTCARCLEEYDFALDARFQLVLTPRAAAVDEPSELRSDDLGLCFYDGDEIDVSALVHEQTILALPTRPLCAESCRGLCPQCGVNLNTDPCGCPVTATDPRLAVLRTLARGT